jgi:hypothetical protein
MCPLDTKLLNSVTVAENTNYNMNQIRSKSNNGNSGLHKRPSQGPINGLSAAYQGANSNRQSPNNRANNRETERRRNTVDAPMGTINQKTPSPTRAYAGAKCHEAPSPNFLPAPPIHWTSANCAEMTSLLKVMLNVS